MVQNNEIKIIQGDLECSCGNNLDAEGFYPCNELGEYVEPGVEWDNHYRCSKCYSVILLKED